MHQEPCCTCAAKCTLYERGGIKNLKLINKLTENMRAVRITDNLFQVEFEVQLKNSALYEELFPITTNPDRYDRAILETRAMVKRN